MTEHLIRIWGWIGGHRLVAGWVVALLAVGACSGGAALGAARAHPGAFPEREGGPVARATTTVVEAVVMGQRGNTLITRTRSGELLRVRLVEATKYRVKNKPADASAVRRGAKIVVVGRPLGEGLMRARAISVRGRISLADPPPEMRGMP